MAVNLLEYSYQDSNFNTIALLDKRLEDFNNKTVIELAHMAKNKHFIAHYVCQRWLNRRWFGNLLIRKFEWGPIKIPNWAKVKYSIICQCHNILVLLYIGLRLWCLMPFSTIFHLYRGSQFY